jgi:hypothetical protein
LSGRETPYFPDVNHRVVQQETREAQARDTLIAINRKKIQVGENPLQWEPFWDEWRRTHHLDGEGFSDYDSRLGAAALAAY